MDVDWLHTVAARQRGLIAVRQGPEHGVARSTLTTHLARRGWTMMHPGVWLAPGAPPPSWLRLRVAVLSVGPPVAAARWTSAALHGLHPRSPLIQLLVPAGRRATTLARTQTLRTRTWADQDVTWIDGVPAIRMARTIGDLAAVADLDPLRRLVIDARQRRHLDLPGVVEHLARAGNIRGRRKVERIVRDLDATLVDSEFERLVVRWLRSVGFEVQTQFPLQTRTGLVHLDLALPALRVAIECEGFGSHSARKQHNRDTRRQNAISGRDWTVLRLTWDEFTTERSAFLADLHDAVAAA